MKPLKELRIKLISISQIKSVEYQKRNDLHVAKVHFKNEVIKEFYNKSFDFLCKNISHYIELYVKHNYNYQNWTK